MSSGLWDSPDILRQWPCVLHLVCKAAPGTGPDGSITGHQGLIPAQDQPKAVWGLTAAHGTAIGGAGPQGTFLVDGCSTGLQGLITVGGRGDLGGNRPQGLVLVHGIQSILQTGPTILEPKG